jgi:Tfp pilus assembly protein PilF
LEEAIAGYEAVLSVDPRNGDAARLLATALAQTGQLERALSLFDLSRILTPTDPQVHNNRGLTQQKMGLLGEALASYEEALRLHSGYADAHYNRGNVLRILGRFEDALESFSRALCLRPDHADALCNRGATLAALGRGDEALECYAAALVIRPRDANAHYCRGNLLLDIDLVDQALASYEDAISADSNHANAHFMKGVVLLSLGRYLEGWRLFEWRLKTEEIGKHYPVFPMKKPWRGSAEVRGKKILIQGEQGFGDVIQFARYLPQVSALGAEVVVQVRPEVAEVVKSIRGNHMVVSDGGALPDFDFYCPMMSLPFAFRTELETIPAASPYIHPDPFRVSAWRERLGSRSRPRIGIVWSGSAEHDNDANRSIGLGALEPLLDPSFEWHSLQKQYRDRDLPALERTPNLHRHEHLLRDFADTAALIDCMDLVVSVDTSVAHLSGALGRRTFVLLPFRADFRWMRLRRDSPWYPTMTLIRQTRRGDWRDVLETAVSQLRSWSRESGV